MTYRRTVRNTGALVLWAHAQLEQRREPLEVIVREVLDVGRRRGRAELALVVFKKLGLADELSEPGAPQMTVKPSLWDPSTPREIVRELAGAVPISPEKKRRRLPRKP